MSGLPSPIYTIYRDNRGKQVGCVKIGEMEFGRGWGYDSFDDAKDSAAVVAIAGLALTQMRLARQGSQLCVYVWAWVCVGVCGCVFSAVTLFVPHR